MDIRTIGSSSSGNCHVITSDDSSLIIDAGIHIKRVRESTGFSVSSVSGCLVSHAHFDHAGHAKSIMKAGVDCYMSEATASDIGVFGHHRARLIDALKEFRVGEHWRVVAVPLEHDVENFGFLVVDGNGDKLLYLIDTAYCHHRFRNINYLMIEANWSGRTLAPDLDPVTKRRIMRSHFSLENVKEFIKANDMSKLKECHLIHLSRGNSDEAMFRREIQELTGVPVYVGSE